MIKTKEPSPEMAEASRPSGFRAKRRSWREDEIPPSVSNENRSYSIVDTQAKSVTGLESSSNLVHNGFTNQAQTEHKPDTNQTQTEHKTGDKVDTNQTQTEHKTGDKNSETEHKLNTQPYTSKDTKCTQTEYKLDTKPCFTYLTGTQRDILILIYRSCLKGRSQISEQLSIEHIAISLLIRSGSVKTTIARLIEKGFLKRIDYKNGRGGWSRYLIFDATFKELFQIDTEHKLNTNRTQMEHKVDTQPYTQPYTSPSSSSSILINKDLKLTTTSENEKDQLSDGWRTINFSSLLEQGVPFSEIHLLQLVQRTKHTSQMVQDAIEHFAFDLKHNDKKVSIKGDLLGFFMGIMQRGMYAAPSNFVDPREAELDQYLAQQEAKLARMQEKLAKKENLDFEIWLMETTEEQRREIAPHAKQDMSDMQRGILRNYWKSNKLTESQRGNHAENF